MKFNEDSRVKIPSILHFCRLVYKYISLNNAVWDAETNIFTQIFKESIVKIYPDFDYDQAEQLLVEISLLLSNEDLGKAYFEKLTSESGVKLIAFENFENNTFDVVSKRSGEKLSMAAEPSVEYKKG